MAGETKPCPLCGKQSFRALYYGGRVWLCEDEDCSCMHGWWADLVAPLPFNGMFLRYPKGGYWRALWWWLKGGME